MSKREQNIRDAIRLIRSANVGPITYHQLIALYGSASKALEALPELAARGGGKRKIRVFSESDADKEFKAVKKAGAELLLAGDTNYPLHLTHIPDAPPVLTYLGNIQLLEKTCVAIVGARNASAATSIDELVTMSDLPVSIVHIILLELELAGKLIRSFRGVSMLERYED